MINIWRQLPSSRLRADNFIRKDYLPGVEKIVQEFFQSSNALTVPIITLQSYTRSIISSVTGIDISQIMFQSSTDCDQWEARADGNGQVGVGLLVGSGGVIIADQLISFNVDSVELTNGDKVYPIDIFGHNSIGWSSRT
ncbi:MAG: hypothetical protein WC979_07925 [Candidatus Pacearchaeota archaeon]|jgi:hypothetical protein